MSVLLALLWSVCCTLSAQAAEVQQLQIKADSNMIATIDVFEVEPDDLARTVALAVTLIKESEVNNRAFIAGAVHRGRQKSEQPLSFIPGFVPKKAWVAIYAQWKKKEADGRGLASTNEAVKLLKEASRYAPHATEIIERPESSFFEPTLLDATGELCGGEDCDGGRNVGPVISSKNPVAQFINVFPTLPDRQKKLLETTYSIMPVARKHNGYLRTALHRSLDGKQVANYGQYENFDQISGMYFHFRTLMAFGQVFFKQVTPPLYCFLGLCIGDYPRLRTYSVEYVGASNANFVGGSNR